MSIPSASLQLQTIKAQTPAASAPVSANSNLLANALALPTDSFIGPSPSATPAKPQMGLIGQVVAKILTTLADAAVNPLIDKLVGKIINFFVGKVF